MKCRNGPKWKTETAAQIMQKASQGDKNSKKVAQFVASSPDRFRDLALILLPFGGIFLIGGVARSLKAYLNSEDFIKAFAIKDGSQNLIEDFQYTWYWMTLQR